MLYDILATTLSSIFCVGAAEDACDDATDIETTTESQVETTTTSSTAAANSTATVSDVAVDPKEDSNDAGVETEDSEDEIVYELPFGEPGTTMTDDEMQATREFFDVPEARESLKHVLGKNWTFLGEGAGGQVYKGVYVDPNSDKTHAVVVIKVCSLATQGELEMFFKEVRIHKAIKDNGGPRCDENIIHFKDHIVLEELMVGVIVMEDGGRSLEDLLADPSEPVLTEQEQMKIAREIGTGLNGLHEMGISHQDLKPANILIGSRDAINVKLIDFGLSKDGGSICSPEDTGGTPGFNSPEKQAVFDEERGIYDARAADVWAFGAVLTLLANHEPEPRRDGDVYLTPAIFDAPNHIFADVVAATVDAAEADRPKMPDVTKRIVIQYLRQLSRRRPAEVRTEKMKNTSAE